MQKKMVFFSYKREDAAFALQLAGDLGAAGVNVWIDQLSIRPGERWDKAIEAALLQTDYLLVILSPASVAADNVLDEVNYAIAHKKHIFPVLSAQCDIPFRLQGFQYIDFSKDYGKAFNRLAKELDAGAIRPVEQLAAITPDKIGLHTDTKSASRIDPQPDKKVDSVTLNKTTMAVVIALAVVAIAIYLIFNGSPSHKDIPVNITDTKQDTKTDSITGKKKTAYREYASFNIAYPVVFKEAAADFSSIRGVALGNPAMSNYKTGIIVNEPGITASNIFSTSRETAFRFVLEGAKENEQALVVTVNLLIQNTFRRNGLPQFSITHTPSGKSDTPINSYEFTASPYRVAFNRFITGEKYLDEVIIYHSRY